MRKAPTRCSDRLVEQPVRSNQELAFGVPGRGPNLDPAWRSASEALRNGIRGRTAGFTLIEILVVVVIIGILGAVIVPNLLSRPDQARTTAAQTDLRQLANALDIYRLDNFHYPSTEQGLDALVERPAGFPEPRNWNPDGYIKALPTDPWGSPYIYERSSADFTLFSLGADGVEGGEGTNADVHLEGS